MNGQADVPPAEHPAAAKPPRGLVLFTPGTPRGVRRRRLIFVGLCLAACLVVIGPVFSWVASPFPLILGLPRPMALVIGVVLWVFFALWWLDRADGGES